MRLDRVHSAMSDDVLFIANGCVERMIRSTDLKLAWTISEAEEFMRAQALSLVWLAMPCHDSEVPCV